MTVSTQVESFDERQRNLIKDLFFKGKGTDTDFELFLHVCSSRKLDPFMRQIYPVFRSQSKKDGTKWVTVESMTLQTAIDGYRLIADRTGRYAPGSAPTYTYKGDKVVSATAYVKKMTNDGTWHEISATAYWDEYVQKTKDAGGNMVPTKFWTNMPHNQLAKCAESLALRKAFPAELSGIFTKEEMEQSENPEIIEVQAKEVSQIEQKEEPKQEIKKEILTKAQFDEIKPLWENTEETIKENVKKTLKSQGVKSLAELPKESFEYYKNLLLKHQIQNLTEGLENG